ncbi:hypothetical protein [Eubacterium barkeri]|uniref:Uncharacterized protein n=1 Tax=Eubacterium barkeri TaxID=1528 RepID=A0A1H3IHA9_EUBBA|nr:hypothetical protein [Eubacterium barkeri]SDY27196.1 hypothetical protein SAMN04488579_12324 [Eubacterium barkeri]
MIILISGSTVAIIMEVILLMLLPVEAVHTVVNVVRFILIISTVLSCVFTLGNILDDYPEDYTISKIFRGLLCILITIMAAIVVYAILSDLATVETPLWIVIQSIMSVGFIIPISVPALFLIIDLQDYSLKEECFSTILRFIASGIYIYLMYRFFGFHYIAVFKPILQFLHLQ